MPSQPNDPPLVELADVHKVYGSGEAEVRALDGVNLRIDASEFLAVVGASGSGKSTCMNVLGCLDQPTRGSYRFLGVEVTGLGIDQLALLRRTYIGFVFQGFNLLARTTALENVELPLIYRRVPLKERRERAREALHVVGLDGRERHRPNELSGGQQQRVAIARAIVTEPQVVLADEPTGNLDTARKEEVMALFAQLNQTKKITVVVVTHEANIARWAHRVVSFQDGVIATDGASSGRAL
jgi:putative ABC transport system ATP-binding protein